MDYIFVYGVFRDAFRNLLGDYVFCDKAFVFGKMYQVNEFYPGFIRTTDSIIQGDIYLIDSSILESLDEFEGDEFERRKIWTSIDEESWIYEYKFNIDNFKEITGGDWILR